ncbi:MAG: DUF1820 family protein [Myxococcota bacterium]
MITYRSPEDGSVTSLRARQVGDSDLGPAFVCVSEFVFDTGSRVANPAEEALARRFERTRRLHLSLFTIQSIAEVGTGHPGLQLDQDRSNLVILPTTPRRD